MELQSANILESISMSRGKKRLEILRKPGSPDRLYINTFSHILAKIGGPSTASE